MRREPVLAFTPRILRIWTAAKLRQTVYREGCNGLQAHFGEFLGVLSQILEISAAQIILRPYSLMSMGFGILILVNNGNYEIPCHRI